MTVYQVYPGIQLIYNDFEATSCYWDGTIDKNVLEINHCREGREGSVLQSGSCLYLGEGDLSMPDFGEMQLSSRQLLLRIFTKSW